MQPMSHHFTDELLRLQRDSHDLCCRCGRHFLEGDTSHAGYDKDAAPLYVGDCCASQLVETAARYYWKELPFERPPPEPQLWRYMDFAKFVALLKDNALYFARADSFSDPFEGAKGIAENRKIWDEHYLAFFRLAIKNPPPGHKCELSEEEVEHQAEKLLSQLQATGENERRTTYVSCWHENDTESEALWRLYCPPASAGVAVLTTCEALRGSLTDDLKVTIGRVEYIDFRKGFADINDAIFRKRHSLSHEREVRAVVRSHDGAEGPGIQMAVNLATLISAVVVSPFAPSWFDTILQDVMRRYGINAQVRTSELLSKPFF